MKKILALIVVVFAVAVLPAQAQLGGIIGRAVKKGAEKAVEKTIQKEIDKQSEKISQTIEEAVEKEVEKQATRLDSINQAADEPHDAGKKPSGTVDTSKYDAINAERKAANAKLKYDRWDY